MTKCSFLNILGILLGTIYSRSLRKQAPQVGLHRRTIGRLRTLRNDAVFQLNVTPCGVDTKAAHGPFNNCFLATA
jgi:hypothetical protein